jgi:methyl-accepting chemotaxis protein
MRGLPSIGSLLGIQRTLSAALEDLSSIASGMRLLPELAKSLASIDDRVESLDAEVRQMRAAVERLNGQVGELQGGVDRLSAPLGEIGNTLHPLRRSASRIGRLTRRTPGEPEREPEA